MKNRKEEKENWKIKIKKARKTKEKERKKEQLWRWIDDNDGPQWEMMTTTLRDAENEDDRQYQLIWSMMTETMIGKRIWHEMICDDDDD